MTPKSLSDHPLSRFFYTQVCSSLGTPIPARSAADSTTKLPVSRVIQASWRVIRTFDGEWVSLRDLMDTLATPPDGVFDPTLILSRAISVIWPYLTTIYIGLPKTIPTSAWDFFKIRRESLPDFYKLVEDLCFTTSPNSFQSSEVVPTTPLSEPTAMNLYFVTIAKRTTSPTGRPTTTQTRAPLTITTPKCAEDLKLEVISTLLTDDERAIIATNSPDTQLEVKVWQPTLAVCAAI